MVTSHHYAGTLTPDESKEQHGSGANTKPTVESVAADHLCLSCGACQSVCKRHSIQFQETIGGFLFPVIDKSTCIDCGLCYSVCPGVHCSRLFSQKTIQDPFIGEIISCRVGRSANETIFTNSQSGGIATALLVHLLESGRVSGAVVATMQGRPPRGSVMLARTVDEIKGAQKSKYLPVPMLSLVSDIRESDGQLAFIGLPCHMHGLQNLLSLYPDLESKIGIRIGLFCDCIQTNAVIDFFSNKATNQPVKYLVFKDKLRPSYPGNPVVTCNDGSEVVLNASLRLEVKDFFTPPRCRLCFDRINASADIVLGDPHGIRNIDRKHGETLVLTRTERGEKEVCAAENAGYIKTRKTDVYEALRGAKIDRKRRQWSGYTKCWSDMGRTLPEYPGSIRPVDTSEPEIRKCREDLLQGLSLDAYPDRPAVVRAADCWLQKRRVAAWAKRPAAVLSAISRTIHHSEKEDDTMIVEMKNVGFVNKGAELMLRSMMQKVSEKYPETRFVMVPHLTRAPYKNRARLGIYQKVWFAPYGIPFHVFGALIPSSVRKSYGLILDSEVDVILDASGFAYGRQWGEGSSRNLAKIVKKWKGKGKKVLLLPQAFGPFDTPALKDAMCIVTDHADLIYARDSVSYEHLVGAAGQRPNIRRAPDFTNLLEGIVPADFDREKNRFCIVPNQKMIVKTSPEESTNYKIFLKACIEYLQSKGKKPFILIHEDGDLNLAQEIVGMLAVKITIIQEPDALKIKGIIGTCEGTIGSRFHGLVSALSQGVPSLGTSWSHKYQELFAGYEFSEGLVTSLRVNDALFQKIDMIIEEPSRSQIQEKIKQNAVMQKDQARAMWEEVFGVMNTVGK